MSGSRIPDDAAHGERVHGIVSRNGDDPDAVGHHDVLALPDDSEVGLPQGSDGIRMVDARNLWNVLVEGGDLDFAHHRAFHQRLRL